MTNAEPSGPERGIRMLVLTNMYPTPAEPDFGCFVKDQVDDLRRLGVDATVLAFDGRARRRQYMAAAPRLRRALRRGRYDIVHAHYGLSGALASLQFAAPVVTTFHGSDAWVPWERKVSWLVARRTQPIAVAPVVAANLGIHDAPIIPCAVDLDAFAPVDRAEARRMLGWPVARPCVLFPAARADRSRAMNKRADIFDAMIERLRPKCAGRVRREPRRPPSRVGRPGDERRRRRGDHLDVGGRTSGREGGLGVSYPGRLGCGG